MKKRGCVMPDYALIIALVVFVAVAVVAFKVLQGALKAMAVVAALAAIATGAAGFLVVMDANELERGFQDEKSLFLLSDQDKVLSGLDMQGNGADLIPQQQLEEYSAYLGKRDYQSIKAGYYKLVVIDVAALPEGDANAARKAGYLEEKAKYLVAARNRIFSEPLLLVDEYKKGNVLVYEETPLFKAVRLIPAPIMKFVADRFVEKTWQAVEGIGS